MLEGRQQDTDYYYTIGTKDGIKKPYILSDGKVRVDMGKTIHLNSEIPTKLTSTSYASPVSWKSAPDAITSCPMLIDQHKYEWLSCLKLGNPHSMKFLKKETDKLEEQDIIKLGSMLDENKEYFPEGTNVEIVKVYTPTDVGIKIWERGQGEIMSCGASACAVAMAGYLNGSLEPYCTVHMPGGRVYCELNQDKDMSLRVIMHQEASFIFEGITKLKRGKVAISNINHNFMKRTDEMTVKDVLHES